MEGSVLFRVFKRKIGYASMLAPKTQPSPGHRSAASDRAFFVFLGFVPIQKVPREVFQSSDAGAGFQKTIGGKFRVNVVGKTI